LILKACWVSSAWSILPISEDGKYANISGISPVPSALSVTHSLKALTQLVHFWLAEFDQAKYDSLPKYYKEKIAESSEWRGNKAKEAEKHTLVDDDLSSIPF
jgi:hypothetical protein